MNERASLVEQYAIRGWYCFPLKVGGKQPATRSGLYAGTDDLVTLRRWWKNIDYNIGINCAASGLVVVDLDIDKENPSSWYDQGGPLPGMTWWTNVCDNLGVEPFETYSVCTASGGLHLYYELPEGVTVRSRNGFLAPLVDIKSNGGYVVAAGSETEVGPYEWTGLSNVVLECPSWLLGLVVDPPVTEEDIRERLHRRVAYTKAIDKDHVAVIRKAAERLLPTQEGERNEMLNKIAYGLYMSSPEYLVDEVERELVRCASARGLKEREIRDTLRSARRAARGD
jgi:hypothetical protein